MDIGIDSFAATFPDPVTGVAPPAANRMRELLAEVETADPADVDIFGVGEHHRAEFLDSAPAIILAAPAARTKAIRLASAVTVLSAADPVRDFQEFATLDLLSGGRAVMVFGRGSLGEAFPLFGFCPEDYDAIFAEKLDLLLALRGGVRVTWTGRHPLPLRGEGIFPRPHQAALPVWLGVGGTPQSFVRGGALGLPLMVAIIGGRFYRFRPSVDRYREAGRRAGHAPEAMRMSAAPSISDTVLAPLVAAFRASFPNVGVRVFISGSMGEDVPDGEDLRIEIGFRRDPASGRQRLLSYRNQLVASPAYLRAAPPLAVPPDLVGHPLLTFACADGESNWTFSELDGQGAETLRFQLHLSIGEGAGLTSIMLAGGGMGDLPPVVQPDLMREGRLVEVLPRWRLPLVDLCLVHRTGRDPSSPMRAFQAFAAETVPTLFPHSFH